MTPVTVHSRQHVCFHEAGHAVAALLVGARLVEFEVTGTMNGNNRTRISYRREQGIVIPCGGYAAEFLLFQRGLLHTPLGRPLDTSQFLAEAQANAAIDVQSFCARAGITAGLPPQEVMRLFEEMAMARLGPEMDFASLTDIATLLDRKGSLTDADIARLNADVPPRLVSEFRLARLIGHSRIVAAVFAASKSMLPRP